MVPGTEFYMIDWCDAMIDFFVPWDKQFIFSLTNGRWHSFKESTYMEVKYLFFLGLSKVRCNGIFHILLLWLPHYSPTVTISLYESLQTSSTVSRRHLWQLYILDPIFSGLMSPGHPPAPTTVHTHTLVPWLTCGPIPSIFISLCLSACVHPSDWNACFLSSPPHSSFKDKFKCHFLSDFACPSVVPVVGLPFWSRMPLYHLCFVAIWVFHQADPERAWGV